MKTFALIQLDEILSRLQSTAMSIVGKLVFALVIFIVGRSIIKLIKRSFTRWHTKKNLGESAYGFMSSCINIVLNLILVLTIASVLGVPMTSIITLIGSAGLAVGLALQGGLSNFAGGVIILIFKPFEVGDYIVCGADEGTVQKINVFYTTLVTPDNRHVVIPNSTVSNSSITNVTAEGERRLDVPFSVPSSADIETVRGALLPLVEGDERVTGREAPVVRIVSYGAGAYNFELRLWCKTESYWDVRFELLIKVPEKLSECGIEIAKNAVAVTEDTSKSAK